MTSEELIQLEELHDQFAKKEAVLEKALAYGPGTHCLNDVWRQIEDGEAQFWYGKDSAVVTEIVQTPRRSILRFFLVGGDLEELQRMYPGILEWGKLQGCDLAMGIGRKGWRGVQFLQEDGWDVSGVVYEKELQDERRRTGAKADHTAR